MLKKTANNFFIHRCLLQEELSYFVRALYIAQTKNIWTWKIMISTRLIQIRRLNDF